MTHRNLRSLVVGAALMAGLGVGTISTAPLTAAATQTATQATTASPATDGALAWARNQLGAATYQGWCLQFVYDAYQTGAGADIGVAPSAVDWWNAHPDAQHLGDTNPPAGALVFWGPTSYNLYGHVAIAEGGDIVISSEERATTNIHDVLHRRPQRRWLSLPGVDPTRLTRRWG